MERYVCIHGHFYQPPRENPWLEAIELQESAFPYHDWNERITAECYAQNARSRVLDNEELIARISNNYSRISFNFGPTLLSWLEENSPGVYASILEADRESRDRFSGHGAAIAQGYGHVILPLANDRDRRTQVVWGLRDFEQRFGRKPEGMWLPETAVNTASLEALAEQGVRFTILAPRQAKRVRRIGGGEWREAKGAVDPSMAYECRLPSGRSIALFFYDGPISQGVAFEGLLNSGEGFARRLLEAFDDGRHWPQLAHIATDGESYGHHHRHGDMALAGALDFIESNSGARLTIYGEYLERHPPTHETEIVEDSSWSCIHGVERWRSDCGCNSGGGTGWSQAWRAPLRELLDWLRDELATRFESAAGALFKDPWGARDDYIDVLLDRGPESRAGFLERHARGPLDEESLVKAFSLMELQRHAMLMYTSCGWFFDDLGGLETVQVIRYAGRVVQLAQDALEIDLEEQFLSRLERARSNVRGRNGRMIYNETVRPAFIDLRRVGAHYAISSLFEEYADATQIYAFEVDRRKFDRQTAGRARLEVGVAAITSRITLESGLFSYATLHLGEHVISAGVRRNQGEEAFARMAEQMSEAFRSADFTRVLRTMDDAFGESNFTISSLFRDEQHKVVRAVTESTLAQVEGVYRQMYDQNAPLIRYLSGLRIPPPRRLLIAALFVIDSALAEALDAGSPDVERVRELLAEASELGIPLEEEAVAYRFAEALSRAGARALESPEDPERIASLRGLAELAAGASFDVELWGAQNACYELLQGTRPAMAWRAASDESARRWLETVDDLARWLRVRTPT